MRLRTKGAGFIVIDRKVYGGPPTILVPPRWLRHYGQCSWLIGICYGCWAIAATLSEVGKYAAKWGDNKLEWKS